MDVITANSLVLRRFQNSDYDDLFEFLSQLKDDEFEGYPDITYENCKKYLSERVGSDEYYAVVLKETGKVIGNVYCGKRDFSSVEVGYIMNENCRRKGYACEAHLRQNIYFRKDKDGRPVWKDTYIYARLK